MRVIQKERFLLRARRMVFCFLPLSCGIVLTVFGSIHFESDRNVIAKATRKDSVPVTQGQRIAELKRLTIRPTGFDPTQITCTKGRIVLAIYNRSGLDQVVLRIRTASGELRREIHVPKDEPNWRGAIELSPGRYTITEVNHSDWVCSINVAE